MNKKQFLKELTAELKSINYPDIDNLIDYYAELIADKKEQGQSEKKIISDLGSIKKIVKNIKADLTLEVAKEKPTISNSIKATLAILGVLSLPLLIPLAIVFAALLFVAITILISLVITVVSIILSAIIGIGALFYQVFSGEISFVGFIFALGLFFVILGLGFLLAKWLMANIKIGTHTFIIWLQKRFKKRNEVNKNE